MTAGSFSIGVEAPLDNDWRPAGEHARQRPDWIGQHMDGSLAYPGSPDDHARRVAAWRTVTGSKPCATFIHLDLDERADAPMLRWRFGFRGGRDALIAELHALRAVGIDHVSLHFRRNRRPLGETFHEIAEYVPPHFPIESAGAVAPVAETHHV